MTSSASPNRTGAVVAGREVLGIDEAGRGAALGPLVVAGVVIDPEMEPALKRLGVGDSKGFASGEAGRAARRVLAGHVHQLAEVVVVRVFHAKEVDEAMNMKKKGGLDELERTAAKNIIEEVQKAGPVWQVVADGRALFEPLADCYEEIKFKAVDHADRDDLAVAAASIVAKSHRDVLFARICRGYRLRVEDALPELSFDWDGYAKGGGYPNDDTKALLRCYGAKNEGARPPETRGSWEGKKWGDFLREFDVPRPPRGD